MTPMHLDINRLTTLSGTDPAFYILALHSYIEAFLRREVHKPLEEDNFYGFVKAWWKELKYRNNGNYIKDLDVLDQIRREHHITNEARHNFHAFSPEEALAATSKFLTFCELSGIDQKEALETLQQSLSVWEERGSRFEDLQELKNIRFELFQSRRDLKLAMEKQQDFQSLLQQKEELSAELALAESRIKRADSGKMDLLRKERQDLKMKLRDLGEQLKEHQSLKGYVDHLKRFTLYTRTRGDYERRLLRFSEEQERALSVIDARHDALIKGGAGTGKTLVLLEGLKRMRKDGPADHRALLLTYTSTLTRYDAYLAEIMGIDSDARLEIKTLDSFFRGLLDAVLPGSSVDYKNRDELNEYMIQSGEFSRIGALQFLLEQVDKTPEAFEPRPHTVLVDESQDLLPVQLTLLKKLALNNIILAGDVHQSIFGPMVSYASCGVHIQGRTRILKTNFRSTHSLSLIAERFRTLLDKDTSRGDSADEDSGAVSSKAFREGPAPELFTADRTAELYPLLVQRLDLMINHLGYEPGNIAVLSPGNFHKKLAGAIQASGWETCDLKREQDFSDVSRVRLCTLQSIKGLDIPVVFLFLPRWIPGDPQNDINLVYVVLSRAMDILDVFMKEEPQEDILIKLKNILN